MKWSKITKFLLGSTLGLVIVVGAVLGVGYLLIRQFSAPPPKPIFANDSESVKNPGAEAAPPDAQSAPSPAVSVSPSPSEGYPVRVTYPEGLILRDAPNAEAAQIGGIGYNQEVIVLEETEDQEWQRVRLPSSEEGWIRAGNVERIE